MKQLSKNERIKIAQNHHKDMLIHYGNEIQFSIMNSEVYTDSNVNPVAKGKAKFSASIVEADTVKALFELTDGKAVVLNFASYKNPGGGFLSGSRAQEESLCLASTLYEVLSSPRLKPYYEYNVKHVNNSLYKDRAIWSPDIYFEYDSQVKKADVLTCAAPNKNAYLNNIYDSDADVNSKTLRSRINFIANVIKSHPDIESVVLGAFGCGVFGQDPYEVAELFNKAFANTNYQLIFAIIGGGDKFKAFKDTFIK